MRFGVHVPNFGDFHDPRAVAELAHEAEAAGWDGFFLWDHILYARAKRPVLDPWIALAATPCTPRSSCASSSTGGC